MGLAGTKWEQGEVEHEPASSTSPLWAETEVFGVFKLKPIRDSGLGFRVSGLGFEI